VRSPELLARPVRRRRPKSNHRARRRRRQLCFTAVTATAAKAAVKCRAADTGPDGADVPGPDLVSACLQLLLLHLPKLILFFFSSQLAKALSSVAYLISTEEHEAT
jgi:hypothetical protein